MLNTNSQSPRPSDFSTGPTSAEGKAASSRNALKHGCCSSETLILKSENIEDYKSLEAIWLDTYRPQDPAERHLVQELVNSDWFLQRSTRTVHQIEAQLLDQEPNPLNWTTQQQNTLARFLRYQTTRSNTVARCRQAIEQHRKLRISETLCAHRLRTSSERHEIYKEKNKPRPSIQELIQNMMASGPQAHGSPETQPEQL